MNKDVRGCNNTFYIHPKFRSMCATEQVDFCLAQQRKDMTSLVPTRLE